MKRRYLKWAIVGVTVAIVGSFGLYWTWSGAPEADAAPTDEQRILRTDEKPVITAPGGTIGDPERQVDTRAPGGGAP